MSFDFESQTQRHATAELDEQDDDRDDDDEEEEEEEASGESSERFSEGAIEERPAWVTPYYSQREPPNEFTVTHVKQTHDLQRVSANLPKSSDGQNSAEWLMSHSISELKLDIKDLIDKGKVGKPIINEQTGKLSQHIQFESSDINEFEYKLNMAIETYTKRIKWLLTGSKRVFGLVKGTKVAVLIDASDANTGFGRLSSFQDSLIHLIDEQLTKRKSIYLASFGTDYNPCWGTTRDVNCRTIDEAKEFVMNMQPGGGCNLLKAVKHVMKLKDINSICLILGSVPDQSSEILCDFVQQLGVGKEIPLQSVAYDCSNHLTNLTLRNLAEESKGRYHCYTATCEEQIYTSTDISILLQEIQKAQDVINKIKEMRQGMMGNALVTIMNEITMEISKLPQSRFLPRPPGHEQPINIEMPRFTPRTSADWMKQHGLKAKSLDLYQVLAPNAYTFKEEFIPVIRKMVTSQVHEKVMAQFQWHDGSTRNIHVDMAQLFEYQKQLGHTVGLYEKRINWLSTQSRKIFGAVSEKRVVILVDLSVSNINYLVHIQHSLRLLLEQQMGNKEYFNIIGFGSNPKPWRSTMAKVTPENLQACWKWILNLECNGSRNFLGALRHAVENEEEIKHHLEVEGIYLFTSGIPDQPADVITGYTEEVCIGRGIKVHSILFNVDDYDTGGPIPSRYANITKTADALSSIAHCSGGRFHWFRETGIIDSDDINVLTAEIEKAVNFSKKCAMLVDSVKRRYVKEFKDVDYQEALQITAPPKLKALPAPRQTALSMARILQHQEQKPQDTKSSEKAPPLSTKNELTVSIPKSKRPVSAKDPMLSVRLSGRNGGQKVQQVPFYTGEKNKVGTVFKKYPGQKSVRKQINQATIPDNEDQVTTREWLKYFGLNKLGLDLNKLVSGPDCKHKETRLKVTNNFIEAKYCNIFPSVNVNGTIKHLQLLPHELETYVRNAEKVLHRYLKRLQWLLSGSRRVFGTVVHRKCCVLIDTSGSMELTMDELKKELVALIWEQLHRIYAEFNLISFSGCTKKWQPCLTEATEENCHDAVEWVSRLKAHGNTCTLEALEEAFADPEVGAIYLLTDGKPDTSTAMVLREMAKMNADRKITINTISFNCSDSTANNFLKMLAGETGGRYHQCHSDFDADLFAHKLLTDDNNDLEFPHLPDFEGDDLRKLGVEIVQARRFLAQARNFQNLISKQGKPQNDNDSVKETMPQKPVFVVGKMKNTTVY